MKTAQLTAIVTMFISVSVCCMQSFSIAPILYFERCKQIDQESDKIFHKFLEKTTLKGDKGVLDSQQVIEDKIDRFEKKLIKERNDLFSSQKEQFNINNESWQRAITSAQLADEVRRTKQLVPFKVIHDENIPKLFMALLKKEICLQGLDPNSFTIKEDASIEGCCADSYEVNIDFQDGVIERAQVVKPGYFKMNKKIWLACGDSYQMKQAACTYLVSMMMARKVHPLLLFGIPNEKCFIANNQTMNPFIFLHALQDQRVAALLKTYYREDFACNLTMDVGKHLENNCERYKKICKIDRLLKLRAWFKEYADLLG
jgi:hypothetical protein